MLSSATILVLSILIVLSCCMAETYTQKTGPFTIKVTSNESVDFTVISPMPITNFNAYDVNMNINKKIYELEIQDYGKPINVEFLMPAVMNFFIPWDDFYTSWEQSEVGSKPGIIGIIGTGGTTKTGLPVYPGFVAAYSPDGIGTQGTTLALMDITTDQKNFDQDKAKFEDFVKNIRILKTG